MFKDPSYLPFRKKRMREYSQRMKYIAMSLLLQVVFLCITQIAYITNGAEVQQVFPLAQFFNVSTLLPMQYFSNTLCSSNDEFNNPICCECDASCDFYGTCCIDKYWKTYDYNSGNLQSYVNLLLENSTRRKPVVCKEAFSFSFLSVEYSGGFYLMVASCLPGASASDVGLCLGDDMFSLQSRLPVLGDDNYVYKNQYCALCNLVRSYSSLSMKARCQNMPELGSFTGLANIGGKCDFQIDTKGGNRKTHEVKRCREGSAWNRPCSINSKYYDLCHAYTGVFAGYANFHCFLCDNEDKEMNTAHLNKSVKEQICNYDPSLLTRFGGWSSLLRLEFNPRPSFAIFEAPEKLILNTTCNEQEYYDLISAKCIQHICPDGYQTAEFRCVRDTETGNQAISTSTNSTDLYYDKCFRRYHLRSHNYTAIVGSDISSDGLKYHKRYVDKWKDDIMSTYATSDPYDKECRTPLQKIEGGISLAGTSVSVLCYIIMIVTYLLLENLRNYGIALLCVCLLISDTFFLTFNILHESLDVIPTALCETVAVLMHCGLLCAHTSGIILAVDVASKCGSRVYRRSTDNTARAYFRYRKLSFLAPIVTTIVALILHKTGVVDSGYGENGICLITGFYGRLIFFVIPAALALVVSTVALSYTMCMLAADKRAAATAALEGSSGRRNVHIPRITLKLILTYGLTEAIGFAQIPRGRKLTEGEKLTIVVVGFTYSAVRSLRGILLFLLHVCNKRVLSEYRRILRGSERLEFTGGNRNQPHVTQHGEGEPSRVTSERKAPYSNKGKKDGIVLIRLRNVDSRGKTKPVLVTSEMPSGQGDVSSAFASRNSNRCDIIVHASIDGPHGKIREENKEICESRDVSCHVEGEENTDGGEETYDECVQRYIVEMGNVKTSNFTL